MTEAKRTRGRPRRAGADEEILSVARQLLSDAGYRAFSVDDIATKTGIAKTTIYRRWPSKGALVAAAIATPPPQSNDARAIVEETASVLHLLRDPDADALEVIRAVLAPRRAMLHELVGDRADELLGALVMKLVM